MRSRPPLGSGQCPLNHLTPAICITFGGLRHDRPTLKCCLFHLCVRVLSIRNIKALNLLRLSRGLHPLALRPHCGEAGSESHLAVALLLANGINHGIVMKDWVVLQYLYYLEQVCVLCFPTGETSLYLFCNQPPTPFPLSFFLSLFLYLFFGLPAGGRCLTFCARWDWLSRH